MGALAGAPALESGRPICDAPANWSPADVFRAAPAERDAMIVSGVSARWAKVVLGDLIDASRRGLGALNFSKATLDRKAALNASLSSAQGQRAIDVVSLVGQVDVMMEESGGPEGFSAAGWLAEWLEAPLSALGGERPVAYIGTAEGRDLLSRLLAQMQTGTYA